MSRSRLAALLAAALAAAAPARAALSRTDLERVGVHPPPGAAEPLGLAFTDADRGARTTLGAVAGGGPWVLVFADSACTALCGPALAVTGDRLLAEGEAPGRDWRLAVVDLRPDAAAPGARAFADARLPPTVRRATAVLTGDAAAVRRAADAVGYGYVWDSDARQFAHPVAAFVLAADGRLVRTLSEVALTPAALRDALADARAGRASAAGLLEQVALVCHGALEAVGRFDGAAIAGLRAAALLTLAALPALVWWSARRRRRARA